MPKRKSLSKKLRFEIFKRDKFKCQYCGKSSPDVLLEVDHIKPVVEGGDNSDINLITACFDCNRGKGKHPLSEVPQALNEKLKFEKEKVEQIKKFNDFLMESRKEIDEHVEELGLYWFNKYVEKKDSLVFGAQRENTIRNFLRKMFLSEIYEAMDISWSKDFYFYNQNDDKYWRYFCGVCWNKIRDKEAENE